ncbi:tRNA pseudouridine(55) synthase TruB [Patescibacteria group bacterium]|nr:tRNA pseudouridine(55) synthase TruB [Patescibacteria group bacterium]
MIDGILLIDKEEGITSYDVIRRLKHLLPHKYKIGHAGTLDPFATGLLIILVGKATKLMDTIHGLEKEYEVTAEFGYATDTQDCTGEKIHTAPTTSPIGQEELETQIKENFLGNISQLPPIYSAKKVNGQKSYDLARQGKEVELKPKDIHVTDFEIIKYEWPFVTFRIACSTGTYIRTLVNDLGEKVETYATAVALRRTRIGEFNVDEAISTKAINESSLESIMGIDKVKEILKK